MTLVAIFVLQAAAGAASLTCTADQRRALAVAETLMAQGDDQSAIEALADRADGTTRCVPVALAFMAMSGWAEARRLAPKGGAPDLLPPVQRWIDDLAALERSLPAGEAETEVLALEAEYARATIRAAIAAAQDERPELGLWLTHARDLTERLASRGRHAMWPRSLNLLMGELWFEVDRYEEARDAFERAVSVEPTAVGLVGLARAEARLGRLAQACEAYARVRGAAPALRQAAATDLSSCR